MTLAEATDGDPQGWRQEARDLARALAAGAIVGAPLIYTMEMWWHGMMIPPLHQLILLGVALGVNFVFSMVSGFRQRYGVAGAVSEAVTAVAMGAVFSLVLLWLIGRVDEHAALSDVVGKVVIEMVAISMGVSFANSQVGTRSREGEDEAPAPPADPLAAQMRQDLQDIAATVIGATVFAFNIAPTEEVIAVATGMSPARHLLLMAASILLCYLILFASGFQERQVFVPSLFQNPWVETVIAYALALGVSAGLLYLVGMHHATSGWSAWIECTIVLGMPATIGAAAGRLII